MKALGMLEAIATIAALVIVAYLAYKVFGFGKKAGDAINDGVNAVVKGVTGGAANGGEDSIGGVAARIREYISGDSKKIDDMKRGGFKKPTENFDALPFEIMGGA